jgi:hypothetical protein
MKFHEQVSGLVQCKADGICARDKLMTVYLNKQIMGEDTDDTIFATILSAKESDDKLVIEMLEKLNDHG